ncbi:MAG TPA: choice-of-anchor tandem repeat GloVer-containing protein [Rhizomicrobium sp.]|nr:choice-of-anchor tandem repeat GloVer-containing protein [Rhizomicrobium sp.]
MYVPNQLVPPNKHCGSKENMMFRFLGVAGQRILTGAFALAVLIFPDSAEATTFKVLYSFTGGSNGGNPISLTRDSNGNLYGAEGQPPGVGSVFKLAPSGSLDIHYLLKGGEGATGVVVDSNGSLWVTVLGGGTGCGVIFEIRPTGREALKHTFTGQPTDGCGPVAALIKTGHGNFSGTTTSGGKHQDGGTVFELSTDGSDKIIYNFCRKINCTDGGDTAAGLIMDQSGNFYGTSSSGGGAHCAFGNFTGHICGTVFKLTRDGTESVLYKFKGSPNDGAQPSGGVIMDQTGNFYGTAAGGGLSGPECEQNFGCGIAFKLAPDGTETVLHFFTGKNGDGGNPVAGLVADSMGNLYGSTPYGGDRNHNGTVFKIAADGTETVIHTFNGTNGASPYSGLVADGAGNLYGTSEYGGTYGYGTVFEITP